MAGLQLAAQGRRVGQLRAGHDGDAEHVCALVAHEAVERVQGARVQVAVDDLVLVATFEQGAERQQGERHHRLTSRGAGRVVED